MHINSPQWVITAPLLQQTIWSWAPFLLTNSAPLTRSDAGWQHLYIKGHQPLCSKRASHAVQRNQESAVQGPQLAKGINSQNTISSDHTFYDHTNLTDMICTSDLSPDQIPLLTALFLLLDLSPYLLHWFALDAMVFPLVVSPVPQAMAGPRVELLLPVPPVKECSEVERQASTIRLLEIPRWLRNIDIQISWL